jgi:hypothetical protein
MPEIWVKIPHTPGDPKPRISDGVYRGIRLAADGGFEGIPRVDPRISVIAGVLSDVDFGWTNEGGSMTPHPAAFHRARQIVAALDAVF